MCRDGFIKGAEHVCVGFAAFILVGPFDFGAAGLVLSVAAVNRDRGQGAVGHDAIAQEPLFIPGAIERSTQDDEANDEEDASNRRAQQHGRHDKGGDDEDGRQDAPDTCPDASKQEPKAV